MKFSNARHTMLRVMIVGQSAWREALLRDYVHYSNPAAAILFFVR
ncbi:MAG: hypothetical protein Q7T21_05700 [Gallionella sp.]|nr:hypothetical protein [Gallionella sp.]